MRNTAWSMLRVLLFAGAAGAAASAAGASVIGDMEMRAQGGGPIRIAGGGDGAEPDYLLNPRTLDPLRPRCAELVDRLTAEVAVARPAIAQLLGRVQLGSSVELLGIPARRDPEAPRPAIRTLAALREQVEAIEASRSQLVSCGGGAAMLPELVARALASVQETSAALRSYEPARGVTFSSPHEPYLAAPQTSTYSLVYHQWPYNRGRDRGPREDLGTSSVDLSFHHVLFERTAFGMRVPFLLRAEAPARLPERSTGLGDTLLGVSQILLLASGGQPLDVGVDAQLTLPTGRPKSGPSVGTGVGVTRFGLALKAAYRPRSAKLPRPHLRLGYATDLDADHELGAAELVLGMLGSDPAWQTRGRHERAYGYWLDWAYTRHERAERGPFAGDPAPGDRPPKRDAHELRLGGGYALRPADGGTMHLVFLELGLDVNRHPELGSRPFAWRFGYSIQRAPR